MCTPLLLVLCRHLTSAMCVGKKGEGFLHCRPAEQYRNTHAHTVKRNSQLLAAACPQRLCTSRGAAEPCHFPHAADTAPPKDNHRVESPRNEFICRLQTLFHCLDVSKR